MIEYPKIETIFERSTTGSKKLIEGQYRNPAVAYLNENRWMWTEKVDGTNISIIWSGHEVTFAGRTERAQIPANLVNYLNLTFGGPVNEELFEQKFGNMPVILYGEGYGANIQNKVGKLYRDDVSFILFDVYIPGSNLWMTRESVEDIAQTFDIDVVPVVKVGTLPQAVEFIKSHPASTIAKNGAPMEGVVCRPVVDVLDRRGRRLIVKVKVKDFEGN